MANKSYPKEAVRAEIENCHEAPKSTWISWKEVPLLLLVIPVGFLLGLHVAFFAMLIRWLTRLPYWLALVFSYVLLILPLWFYVGENVLILTIGTIIVLIGSLLPMVFDDDDGILNGGNLEHSAPAHLLLVLLYLLIPAVNAAKEAHQRIKDRQNNETKEKPSIERDDLR